jgi:polyisoprenoid-binding protein YceI
LHPINTETRGITGWFEATTRDDGSLDLSLPVSGELELAVARLTSGNQLYDHELRRRMEARRFPTIVGRVTSISANGAHPRYAVTGDVSFHGKTKTFEHEMHIEAREDEVSLTGAYVFDIREFGMKPPSMLMVRVYPEISVRIELLGTRDH